MLVRNACADLHCAIAAVRNCGEHSLASRCAADVRTLHSSEIPMIDACRAPIPVPLRVTMGIVFLARTFLEDPRNPGKIRALDVSKVRDKSR